MKIVEVNDNDIYGKVFNGYDIAQHFNGTDFDVKQIVLHKFSDSDFVVKLFDDYNIYEYETKLHQLETDILSVQSMLSFNNDFLINNKYYKCADVVHFHQIHNSHFNLYNLFNEMLYKPTVVTLHDPWLLTGRCVHPGKCNKWKNGCKNCQNLNTLFSFKKDNANSMWRMKSLIKNSDIDLIVSSKFMLDMVKVNPYLKKMRVHLLPFGVDLDKYKKSDNKLMVKKELGIDEDSFVIFFREQLALKGTDYIVEALKKLNIDEKITLLTCSEVGLLDEIKDKYDIIELGNIDENMIIKCYQASDLFVMPSLGESFGMMAVEAMASSLPVVIFDNTALPFVTNAPEIGVLVKNLDYIDLHDKIKFLINNPEERIKRGKLGREYAEKNYDLNEYYTNLKKIYHDAFCKQKYKLLKKKDLNDLIIDFNSLDSKIIIGKLNFIYSKLGLSRKKLNILKHYSIKDFNCEKYNLDFLSDDCINIINVFNRQLYDMVRLDNKFTIRNSKIYKKLKSIDLIRRPVVAIKKKFYDIK